VGDRSVPYFPWGYDAISPSFSYMIPNPMYYVDPKKCRGSAPVPTLKKESPTGGCPYRKIGVLRRGFGMNRLNSQTPGCRGLP
jgi:hypothetical protein